MGLRRNSVIADIGCGTGVMFEHLLKTEPLGIIAVDISRHMDRKGQIAVRRCVHKIYQPGCARCAKRIL